MAQLSSRPAALMSLIALVAASARADTNIARVSVDSNGNEGNNSSPWQTPAAVSQDGRFVAFASAADNLVAGDTNVSTDIFVHDRRTGATVRVSVKSSGHEATGESYSPSLSSDGRFVAFESSAKLVNGDRNRASDIFRHDRDPDGNGLFDEGNGVTIRASVDSAGGEGDAGSRYPSISGDGMRIAFFSDATNLVAGDVNGMGDVFVRDLAAGTTSLASVDSNGVQGNANSFYNSIARDGSAVAFTSYATTLVPNDTNGSADIFVHDLATGVTERMSVDSSGMAWSGDSPYRPQISADGAVVAFASYAPLVAGTNGLETYVHDRRSGVTELESVTTTGAPAGSFEDCALSDDGNRVVFATSAAAIPDDQNGFPDLFVRDRAAATTTIGSWPCARRAGDNYSFWPALSGDGATLAFASNADNLVDHDTNGFDDLFVNDLTLPDPDAAWSNYGVGFPGTFGIPALDSNAVPRFGTTITVQIGNSSGAPAFAVLLIGTAAASIPTLLGGDLLVDSPFVIPLTLGAGGETQDFSVPYLDTLCGVRGYLQAIESDPGAAKGFAFTPGLELILGH